MATPPALVPPPSVPLASSLSWRAIFAGLAVAALAYLVLVTLGVALVAGLAHRALLGGGSPVSGQGVGWGAAAWLACSAIGALYLGAHAAARTFGPIPRRIGRLQGVVVAGLFFGLVLSQLGAAAGWLGHGPAGGIGPIGSVELARNPDVQDMFFRAIAGTRLRSPPDQVIEGLITRAIDGDDRGAIESLSRETGLSLAEAADRWQRLRFDFLRGVRAAGEATSRGVMATAWSILVSLVLGTLAALVGGTVGARMSLRRPVDESDRELLRESRAA